MPRRKIVGDDDLAATGLSGFDNEQSAEDDSQATEAEEELFNRLSPVLETLNNIIDEHVDQVTSITTLIIGKPSSQMEPEKVMIELRARELHLDFLEKFRSRIKNTQNTIEELRNNGS